MAGNIKGSDLLNALRASNSDADAVQILGGGEAYNPDQVLRTGSLTFDYATGRGGIKKGAFVHIYGPEGSGKTTISLSSIGEIHRNDPDAGIVYFDMENALSPEWMEVQGVNLNNTAIVYPEHQEDLVNQMKGILKQTLDGAFGKDTTIPAMVIDSIAATHAKEVEESSADEETSRAKEARVWSKHLGSIAKLLRQTGTVCFAINQARDSQSPYGPKYTFPGGRNIKHVMSINVLFEFQKKLSEYDGDTKILHGMKGKLEKNKTSGSLGSFVIRWRAGEGISKGWGLIDVLDQIEINETMKKKRMDFDAETFQSAFDYIPYKKGFKWDQKADEPVSSANAWSIVFDDDLLEAIYVDDPDFDDKGLSGKSFANKASFIKFIDSHPALAELIEEYVLETLNLGLSDEEIQEISASEVDTTDGSDDESDDEAVDDADADEEEYDEDEIEEEEEE